VVARPHPNSIELGMASVLKLSVDFEFTNIPGYPTLETTFSVSAGQTRPWRIVTVFTSREKAQPTARDKLTELPTYSQLLHAHEQAWSECGKSDVVIEVTPLPNCLLLNLFQSPSMGDIRHSPDGYAVMYSGILKFLSSFIFSPNQKSPATAQLPLPHAEWSSAQGISCMGQGQFAWESADTGDEVTPRWRF